MTVVQPGTIQAFEVTPVYSRISGYVEKYRYNIGDRVKAGDVLIDMWIPDLVEQHAQQKVAAVKRAEVQIGSPRAALRAAEAKLETAEARIASARGGREAGPGQLHALGVGIQAARDARRPSASSTCRSATRRTASSRRPPPRATRPRRWSRRRTPTATRRPPTATGPASTSRPPAPTSRSPRPTSGRPRCLLDYGQIKAPYDGVITQRNVSPGDYLQPGGGTNGRPLFVLEQTDPVRVFVGVPELASFFIHEQDTALIRFQAIPGATREGKVVRTGFSLNPSTRTLQTEIDIPNTDGHLHPGWYVTVTIAIDRKQVWTLPSDAIGFQGQQNYYVYLQVDGKPVRTPVIIGLSDDTHTEVLKKYSPDSNTNDWPPFDGTERVLAGNLDVLAESQSSSAKGGQQSTNVSD